MGSRPRNIHFQEDTLRRHHLYVARTRMGKSTLMEHIVAHKMREKAAGRDKDAIVVIDPHADLVKALLKHVPESIVDRVRLIDLGDDERAPGINLLDAKVFTDRDRTADSVVRVAHGVWEQWGPRMQSILEHTVKSLHEYNRHPDTGEEEQLTILDGLRMLSDVKFRNRVLRRVDDPYVVAWWGRDLLSWTRTTRSDALAPVQTPAGLLRLLQEGPGHPGAAPLHHRPAGDHPGRAASSWSRRPRGTWARMYRPWWGRRCSTWWTR